MSLSATDLHQLMAATRSCRRFREEEPVSLELLENLVELARLGGSARNLQPLKYLLIHERSQNRLLFPHLFWAGYLEEWPGPAPGERPAAYIVCLLDQRLAREAECDLGIASQNILLGATARGLAGCRIGSVAPEAQHLLQLPPHLRILLAIGLGVPGERVVLQESGPDGNIRYWRDAEGGTTSPNGRWGR